MSIEPTLNYFSIWQAAFRILHRHAGLIICTTLLVAGPFFVINGLVNANHMMWLGGAAMTGSEIPLDEMRLLWGSVVGGDSLAFIALAIAGLLLLKHLHNPQQTGFGRHVRVELPRLLGSAWFWLFVALQIVFFAMINTPDGRFKLSGMALFAGSVLMLWSSQDREAPAYGKRLRRLGWKGWLSLAFVVLTFPVLYILFNGYLNNLLLMLVDLGGQQIMHLFSPTSAALPFCIITLSKFLSQWFNLLPMALLLSAYLATRGALPAPEYLTLNSGLNILPRNVSD